MKIFLDANYYSSIPKANKIVENIAILLKQKLNKYGHEIIGFLPTIDFVHNDINCSVQRAVYINNVCPDIVISLDLNANSDVTKNGTEIYANTPFEKLFANTLLENICISDVNLDGEREYLFNNNGVKSSNNIYMVDSINVPSILLKCFYVTNEKDLNTYEYCGADYIATVISSAINDTTMKLNREV